MSKQAEWLAAAEKLEQEAQELESEGNTLRANVLHRLANKAREYARFQPKKLPRFRAGDKVNVRRANGDIVILGGTLVFGGTVPHLEDEFVTVSSTPESKWFYNFCENTGYRLVPRGGRDAPEAWRWVVNTADVEYLLLEKAE